MVKQTQYNSRTFWLPLPGKGEDPYEASSILGLGRRDLHGHGHDHRVPSPLIVR